MTLAGCFNPSGAPVTGTGTETSTGSGSSPGSSDPTVSNTATPTSGAPTSETGATESGETGGCADECPEPGTGCDGDSLEVCTQGPDGCNDLETTDCGTRGCAGGACVGTECGDGAVELGEQCDDGNALAGDGCSDLCTPEAGWTCIGEPSVCTAPDLAVLIESVTAAGNNATVNYRVTNYGGQDSGAFRADIWHSSSTDLPPDLGEAGPEVEMNIPNLAPGESVALQSQRMATPGTAFVIVDAMDDLVEVDENNNASLPFEWGTTFNTVSTSFSSPDDPIEIPTDGAPVTLSVVTSVATTVPEVYFSANITHPSVEDLEVTAQVDGGPERVVFVDAAAGANLRTTTFRDGGTALSDGTPPYLGEWQAAGDWVGAGGTPGTATYRLEVRNNGTDPGRLNAFTVHFFEVDP